MFVQCSRHGHRYRQGRRTKVHVTLLPALILSNAVIAIAASPSNDDDDDDDDHFLNLADYVSFTWAPFPTTVFRPSDISAPRLPGSTASTKTERDGYNVGCPPRSAGWTLRHGLVI